MQKKRMSNSKKKPYQKNKFEGKRQRNVNSDTDNIGTTNDFSWYNRNPLLTAAAANVPFPYRPGMTVPLFKGLGAAADPYSIPGVMVLDWVPTVGVSNSATDPASIAAKELFAQVRASFSGSIDADPPDFIIYLLALDSIFSYIGSLKRTYRILNAYSPQNYQLPDALLKGLGLNNATIQELRKDKANLWAAINELVGMTRKFRCPAVFDLFNRHYWMNDNAYADAPTANSQLYAFNQYAYGKFQVTGDPIKVGNITMIKSPFAATSTTAVTVNDLFTYGRNLINALASGDDAYIISGYLTRAFEGTPNFSVAELAQDETFAPVYDTQVLAQIENSTTVSPRIDSDTGFIACYESCAVNQDPSTNAIISNPISPDPDRLLPTISIRSDTPTVVDVVESTRLAASVLDTKIGSYYAVDCGTELPLRWAYYDLNMDNQPSVQQMATTNGGLIIAQAESFQVLSDGTYLNNVSPYMAFRPTLLTAFDWSPRVVWTLNDQPSSKTTSSMFWEIHNVASISQDQMKQIHRVCLLSEFNSFGVN